jgi:hypothetical protein
MNSGWKSRLNKYNEKHNIITQPVTVIQSGGEMNENAQIRTEYFNNITLNGQTYSTSSRAGIKLIKQIIMMYDQIDTQHVNIT